MGNDKYKNLTLITLNNTLHIKADNLEPVEVEQHSTNEIYVLHLGCTFLDNVAKKNQIKRELKQGIPLPQELSDRIEVREEACDNCINLHGGSNSPNCCNNFKSVAFLLPVKEDKEVFMFPCLNKEQCKEQCKTCESLSNNGFKESDKSYTIEEIEKAIEQIKCNSIQSRMYTDKLKEEIINNLKK